MMNALPYFPVHLHSFVSHLHVSSMTLPPRPPSPLPLFPVHLHFFCPHPHFHVPLNKFASFPFPIHFPIHSYVSALIYNFSTFPGNLYELRNINRILIDIFSIIFSLVSYMKKVIFVYCIYTCLCFGMSYFMVY